METKNTNQIEDIKVYNVFYPTYEDKKAMDMVEILEEQLVEFEEYKKTGYSTEFLLEYLKNTINLAKNVYLTNINHYDFAKYMVSQNGKEKSLKVCKENIEQGLTEFRNISFIIERM